MIRFQAYPVAQILPLIQEEEKSKMELWVTPQDFPVVCYRVGASSLRLRCFKRSTVCTVCGREGTVFALEKSSEIDVSPHLNLYCIDPDGTEILMTHDHIIPKSKGGENYIDNVQTMCTLCNFKKSNTLEVDSLDNLKRLIAELNSSGLTHKEIFNYLLCSNTISRVGFKVTGMDLITIILDYLAKEQKSETVCVECPDRSSCAI